MRRWFTPWRVAGIAAGIATFVLLAGTPPNAIVFGSGYLTIRRMATTGVLLDFLAATLVALWCTIVPRLLFAPPS